MATFIALTEENGDMILLRVDTIFSIRKVGGLSGANTSVGFSAGHFADGVVVRETVHEVAIKISGVEE